MTLLGELAELELTPPVDLLVSRFHLFTSCSHDIEAVQMFSYPALKRPLVG